MQTRRLGQVTVSAPGLDCMGKFYGGRDESDAVAIIHRSIGALNVHLSRQDLERIDQVIPPGRAPGTRYAEAQMQQIGR